MTGPRVFLDASMLFLASNPESAFSALLDWARPRSALVSSDLGRLEAERNLKLRRPDWIQGFDALLGRIEWVSSAKFDLPVELAERDVPLLCSAIRARCDSFVTADNRSFRGLYGSSVLGVAVVSPTGLMERLSSQEVS